MEREIKFRAKDKGTNDWLTGNLLQDDYGNCCIVVFVDHHETWYDVQKETIGQFTGVYDKNGKDVYEGDIVLQQGYNGKKIPMVVRFENGAFIVGYHEGSSTKRKPMLLNSQCEVIGNIHDNENLLNKE